MYKFLPPPLTSLKLWRDFQVLSQVERTAVVSCQKEKFVAFASIEGSWDFVQLPEHSCLVPSEVSWGLLLGLQLLLREGVSFPQVLHCICQPHADVSAYPMWHKVLIGEQWNPALVLIYVPGSWCLESMMIAILWIWVIKRLLYPLSDEFRHFLSLSSVVYHHNRNFCTLTVKSHFFHLHSQKICLAKQNQHPGVIKQSIRVAW